MKKLVLLAIFAVSASIASAQQFAKGDVFLQGQLTGLDFSSTSYDGDNETEFGLAVDGGYFFNDFLAAEVLLGFDYYKAEGSDATNSLAYGIGLRAYPIKNFFIGAAYQGFKAKDYDAISNLNIRAGYDLFISDKVFFEPALYFDKGLSDSNKKISTIGLSVGIGVRF